MRQALKFAAALSSPFVFAHGATSADITLKPGWYSSVRTSTQMPDAKELPVCTTYADPISISGASARFIRTEGCEYSPLKLEGQNASFLESCPYVHGGHEVTYQVIPQSESEFVLKGVKPYLGPVESTYRLCPVDYDTAYAQMVERNAELSRQEKAAREAQVKSRPQPAGGSNPTAPADQQGQCKALENIGVPAAFAQERVWMNPPGTSFFGSSMVQEFLGDIFGGPVPYGAEREKRKAEIEQKKKEAAIRADNYSTREFRDIICSAAKRNIQISFETGWFSSTPQLLVATSTVGKKKSVNATLAQTNDGPDNAPRWRLKTLNVNGKKLDLPQDSSGAILVCLTSDSSTEKVLGFGASILGALFDEEVSDLTQEAGDRFGNSVLAMNDFCKPVRAHLGLEK